MNLCKWTGSKRTQAGALAKRLMPHLREGAVYVEPFFGSGAVYFELRQRGWRGPAVIAEAHPAQRHLLLTLASPKTATPEAIHTAITLLEYAYQRGGVADADPKRATAYERKAVYQAERASHNKGEGSPVERAARWLWLLARGFNGLARTNKKGEHNAPHGDGTGALPTLEGLRLFAAHLRGIKICADWTEALEATEDLPRVIYADPPYAGTFTGYGREGWSACDRDNLSRWLKDANGRGARVLISEGADAREAYPWAEASEIPVVYRVGGGARSKETKEVLLWAGL